MKAKVFSGFKVRVTALLMVLSFLCGLFAFKVDAFAAEEDQNIIIVIDPGHGGKNEGALWNGWVEKEITMVTAKSMKEHLEKFEGVTCILTHESVDDDMDLDERGDFAKAHNADYLICLHYNMSGKHTHYGSEIWIPRKGKNNRTGYQMGMIFMDNFKAIGLSDRGVKTRRNRRKEDYYGILRHAQEIDVPCILVEHAHLDNSEDTFFTNELTDFERFGRIDAESVAMYYGLKSPELGLDFSQKDYKVEVSSKKTYGIPSESITGDYVVKSKIEPVEDPVKIERMAQLKEEQAKIKEEKERQEQENQNKVNQLAQTAMSSLPFVNKGGTTFEGEDPAEEVIGTVNGISDLPRSQAVALIVVLALIFTGICTGLFMLVVARFNE